MAQTGFTPIQLYRTTTAAATPTAGNLADGELAINTTDERLFFKNAAGTVKVIAGAGGAGIVAGSNTQVQFNNNGVFGASANMVFNGTRLTVADLADSGLTAGRVVYSASGGALVDSANLTFDGTNLGLAGGTANGVAYLNGSKVLTTGSALTFDGGNMALGTASTGGTLYMLSASGGYNGPAIVGQPGGTSAWQIGTSSNFVGDGSTDLALQAGSGRAIRFYANGSIEQMRLTSTGLGIGTSSPAVKLQVAGAIRSNSSVTGPLANLYTSATNPASTGASGNGLNFGYDNNAEVSWIQSNRNDVSETRTLFLNPNGGPVAIGATATRLLLDSSGNLGLGVTPSAWQTTNSVRALQFNAGNIWSFSTASFFMSQNAFFNSSNQRQYITSAAATEYEQVAGAHKWFTAPSGTAGDAISFSQAMTLDASGELGIGNTSPAAKLDVVGGASYDGNFYLVSQFRNTVAASEKGVLLGYNNADTSSIIAPAYASGSGALAFWTQNGSAWGERARITSGGYFKASDNGAYVNATASYHEFRNTANSHTVYIKSTSASQAVASLLIDADRNTTNGTFFAIEYYNSGAGATKFLVADSGNVTNTNNSYGAISDAKLKENVTDATPKLDKLNQVRIVNFNMIGDEQKQIGVIAQELEQIFPGMVEESPDRDKDGNDLGTTTKSVKYSVFVPMLIKAIQEQQALITALTARVAALEN
jgi:hypothetical protein